MNIFKKCNYKNIYNRQIVILYLYCSRRWKTKLHKVLEIEANLEILYQV